MPCNNELIERTGQSLLQCLADCNAELNGQSFKGHRVNVLQEIAAHVTDTGSIDTTSMYHHEPDIRDVYFDEYHQEYILLARRARELLRERKMIQAEIIRACVDNPGELDIFIQSLRVSRDKRVLFSEADLGKYCSWLERNGNKETATRIRNAYVESLRSSTEYHENLVAERYVLTNYYLLVAASEGHA